MSHTGDTPKSREEDSESRVAGVRSLLSFLNEREREIVMCPRIKVLRPIPEKEGLTPRFFDDGGDG
jgi:hypothetical protein